MVLNVIFEDSTVEKQINSQTDMDNYCSELSIVIGINYLKETAMRIIRNNFFYFTSSEQKIILHDVMQKFDSGVSKEYIFNKLKTWFTDNDTIDIKGFVSFRLKEYCEYVFVLVQEAVDRYIITIEKNQIISYFKNLLQQQVPYIDTVYIYSDKRGYRILNGNYETIIIINNCGELLLNIMITLAPENIYFCGICDNLNFFDTLLSIFENRIKIINS